MTDGIHSRDIPGPATSDSGHQLAAFARGTIDDASYMTLATADDAGRPWASPVWYAHAGSREFFWVSAPEARHSRNPQAQGGRAWSLADIQAPARLRLYRAIASEVFVLNGRDQRIAVAMTE